MVMIGIRLGDLRGLNRSDSGDLDDRILVASAIPMNASGRMEHVGADLDRFRIVEIKLFAGSIPPDSLDHNDVAVLRMEMRIASQAAIMPRLADSEGFG